MDPTATDLVARLELAPHPEGGHFRRIYESSSRGADGRPVLTGIRFLLARGEVSRWHRVDGDECWHWQQGAPLELLTWQPGDARVAVRVLAPDALGGAPMQVVPAGTWQAARTRGDFTLVACTVSPGFVWEGFELMAPQDAHAARLRELGMWFE
ncbi:MAG TPA: hypothetical protein DDZ67_07315 [Xanthomonadaceae bacterium]|nr:hypothetical protein [Xanthomonadaceae bacterium]